MTDIIFDAARQSPRRWQAVVRRLNGEVLWTGNRIHPNRRAALVEAKQEITRTCWSREG